MANQVREFPNSMRCGDDSFDRRDDWDASSGKESNPHSEFIGPMGARIEEGIEPPLIGQGQAVVPPTRPRQANGFNAVPGDGIRRLLAANSRPTCMLIAET